MADTDEIKKVLSSLIISSAKGLTVKRLLFDFKDMMGTEMPYRKLGFGSFAQYLLSIPDICRLNGTGDHATVIPVVTEKTKHINELILKQRPPKSNSRFRPPKRFRGVYNTRNEPAPPSRPPMKLPITNPNSHNVVLPPPHDYFLEMRRQSKKYYNPAPPPRPLMETPITNPNSHNVVLPPPHDYVLEMRQQSKQNNNKPDQCDTRLRSNCSTQNHNDKPKPAADVEQIDLNKATNQDVGTDEPSASAALTNNNWVTLSESNGLSGPKYVNTSESEEDSDAEFYLESGFSDEDFIYKSEEDEEISTAMQNFAMSDDKLTPKLELPITIAPPHISRVSIKVKEKLKQLIAEYPDGIWCSKLLRLYEAKFNQKLDPLNFGFSSVIQMCDDLPDLFHCIRPNRMDWKIYDKSKPIPDVHSARHFSQYVRTLPPLEDRENTEPALPDDMLYTSPKYNYPDDVVHPGEQISRQWLANSEQIGDYIELKVAEVYDPSKFWIQLKGPTTSDALTKLMDEMQVFYMHNAESMHLNEFSVRIGLVCAALFMKEYHRATVIKVFDDQTIKVFYIDYGTVAQVQLTRTCFLHRKFSELPMQAVRARLANIIPIEQNTMWPRAASNFMLQLVMEKDLVAYIEAMDLAEEVLDLILTDTTQPDVDIHINDALVEKGFAVLGTEAPLCSTSTAVVANVHLYPSFMELENGFYPTVNEVITLLKLDHTYATIFDGYFASEASSFTSHNSSLQHSRCSTAEHPSPFFHNASIHEETSEDQTEYEETIVDEESYSTVEEQQNISNSEDLSNCGEEISPVPTPSIIKPPPGFKNCPPGFEHVQPQNLSTNPLFNMYRKPEPNYGSNPLVGCPLLQNPLLQNPLLQNPLQTLPTYPVNTNPAYNLLSNPALYNQVLMNQQGEAWLHTVRQVKWIEEMQKIKAQQQQYERMSQRFNLPSTSQNVNFNQNLQYSQHSRTSDVGSEQIPQAASTPINNESSNNNLNYYSLNQHQKNVNDQATNLEFPENKLNVSTQEEIKESISNISEHICERCVIKLSIKDCVIHVLKIDEEFYVVSEEIISNLLRNSLSSWRKWSEYVNIGVDYFPNKIVNIMNHENLFNQIKRYSIPGISPPNIFGCIVRLTPLNVVAEIIEKFGNKKILPDLKAGITNVVEKPDMWKVVDSSD